MRALRLLLPAALLLAPAPAAAAAAQDLDRVVTQAIAGWLERRPHLATALGFHAFDGTLAPVTAATVAADLRWLRELEERLAAIPREELSPERRVDRDRLGSWIEHQRLVLDTVEPHRRDPAHLLPVIESGIRALVEGDALAACDRVQAMAARLRRVPEMVRAARVVLRDPPRSAVEAAIAATGETLDFLRLTLPAITRDCRESGAQADLAEADTLAIRALEEYRLALREDLLPRAGDGEPLGAPRLAALLAAAELETAAPDSLLARAEREIAQRQARLLTLAGRVVAGGDPAAALAAIERDSVAEGELPSVIREHLAHLRRGVQRAGLVSLPARRGPEVRWTLIPGRDRPAVRLLVPGPFERGRRRTRLVYESAGAAVSAAGLAARHSQLSRAGLPWALVREAIPGRWPLAEAWPAARRVRAAFPSEAAVEGWCTYAEMLARQGDLTDPEARVEFAGERRAIERLARAAAALALHLRGTGVEEEAQLLARRALIHPENARRAVAEARSDPVAAIAPVLGSWRILELRDEVRQRLGSRFHPRRFHDALLAQGPLPLPMAREGVLRALDGTARRRP